MLRITQILSVALGLGFISCEEKEAKLLEIESNFIFSIEETHDYNEIAEPTLTLLMETEEYYECANYQIVSEVNSRNETLSIKLSGLWIGGICLTAFGPATSSIPVKETLKKLVITRGNEKDEYQVQITPESVKITAVTSSISTPAVSTFLRYPENSFACVCGTKPDYADACDNFRELLLESLNIEEFTFQMGKIPYPDSSSGHWINTASTFYTYTSADTFEEAGGLLEEFANKNMPKNSGVNISLQNWQNKHFRSWD